MNFRRGTWLTFQAVDQPTRYSGFGQQNACTVLRRTNAAFPVGTRFGFAVLKLGIASSPHFKAARSQRPTASLDTATRGRRSNSASPEIQTLPDGIPFAC
jgi:hypothetical protein